MPKQVKGGMDDTVRENNRDERIVNSNCTSIIASDEYNDDESTNQETSNINDLLFQLEQQAENHFSTGYILYNDEEFKMAFNEFHECLVIRESSMLRKGRYHMDTATVYSWMADSYYSLQDYHKAMPFYHVWLRIERYLTTIGNIENQKHFSRCRRESIDEEDKDIELDYSHGINGVRNTEIASVTATTTTGIKPSNYVPAREYDSLKECLQRLGYLSTKKLDDGNIDFDDNHKNESDENDDDCYHHMMTPIRKGNATSNNKSERDSIRYYDLHLNYSVHFEQEGDMYREKGHFKLAIQYYHKAIYYETKCIGHEIAYAFLLRKIAILYYISYYRGDCDCLKRTATEAKEHHRSRTMSSSRSTTEYSSYSSCIHDTDSTKEKRNSACSNLLLEVIDWPQADCIPTGIKMDQLKSSVNTQKDYGNNHDIGLVHTETVFIIQAMIEEGDMNHINCEYQQAIEIYQTAIDFILQNNDFYFDNCNACSLRHDDHVDIGSSSSSTSSLSSLSYHDYHHQETTHRHDDLSSTDEEWHKNLQMKMNTAYRIKKLKEKEEILSKNNTKKKQRKKEMLYEVVMKMITTNDKPSVDLVDRVAQQDQILEDIFNTTIDNTAEATRERQNHCQSHLSTVNGGTYNENDTISTRGSTSTNTGVDSSFCPLPKLPPPLPRNNQTSLSSSMNLSSYDTSSIRSSGTTLVDVVASKDAAHGLATKMTNNRIRTIIATHGNDTGARKERKQEDTSTSVRNRLLLSSPLCFFEYGNIKLLQEVFAAVQTAIAATLRKQHKTTSSESVETTSKNKRAQNTSPHQQQNDLLLFVLLLLLLVLVSLVLIAIALISLVVVNCGILLISVTSIFLMPSTISKYANDHLFSSATVPPLSSSPPMFVNDHFHHNQKLQFDDNASTSSHYGYYHPMITLMLGMLIPIIYVFFTRGFPYKKERVEDPDMAICDEKKTMVIQTNEEDEVNSASSGSTKRTSIRLDNQTNKIQGKDEDVLSSDSLLGSTITTTNSNHNSMGKTISQNCRINKNQQKPKDRLCFDSKHDKQCHELLGQVTKSLISTRERIELLKNEGNSIQAVAEYQNMIHQEYLFRNAIQNGLEGLLVEYRSGDK